MYIDVICYVSNSTHPHPTNLCFQVVAKIIENVSAVPRASMADLLVFRNTGDPKQVRVCAFVGWCGQVWVHLERSFWGEGGTRQI